MFENGGFSWFERGIRRTRARINDSSNNEVIHVFSCVFCRCKISSRCGKLHVLGREGKENKLSGERANFLRMLR
jgi:hypothetical protein